MTADRLPVLWRTKLRSTVPSVNHEEQVDHCLERGLVGIGWGLDEVPHGGSLEQIEAAVEARGDTTARNTIHRFGAQAVVGDFVWTRDTHGRYLLCKITSDYRYDHSDAAKRVDVHQVRSVDWAPRPLTDLEVPGGVIRCFVGTGTSFSRIHDPRARRLTPWLWEKLHDRPLPELDISPVQVLQSHLDPYDVEDLIYVWLQVERGYLMLPRARQRDTPAYEWSMIHPVTKRRGIVQVKTGATPVVLDELAAAVVDATTDTFAFATSAAYVGDPAIVTEVINQEDVLAFVSQRPELLPTRVRTWFELAGSAPSNADA